ncbi:NIPSNAP family protein [Stutzerimonas tarimensis]|uniref:NIPSNAP family protein n=1 Tax=Stutzerimonas tarimensis TaxID=1507735 RepID=A0ABV7T604_9GAMM
MRLFELITLNLRVGTAATALRRLEAGLATASGQLMGCWLSEIGQQNRIALLRGFPDEATRQAERERLLLVGDAFGVAEYLLQMHIGDYSLFPFLQPLIPGAHGPFYELREYDLIPNGLAPTLAGWEKAVGPRTGEAYSPVYAAFFATSGRLPRYLHIWPYASLEQRLDIRTRAVQDGVWPPENSAPQLREMHSTVYLPAAFSPLR